MSSTLTHLNEQGEAHMVDVGGKATTKRTARARSYVNMTPDTLNVVLNGDVAKGDVFATARIAGIQAAKKCADLIPLCHPLMLTRVAVDITIEKENNRMCVEAQCELDGKTGVEMEALTACSVAALTIYDMCKALDKGIHISDTRLIKKTGGKSGDWLYQD